MRVGSFKLKAQLYCGEELAIGPGKADLLEAIAREGSISAAGRALGMSYRRAWQLVDVMNRCWSSPLVSTVSGGGKNRGAVVTETGRAVLSTYRQMESDIAQVANGKIGSMLQANLRETPLAPEKQASPDCVD